MEGQLGEGETLPLGILLAANLKIYVARQNPSTVQDSRGAIIFPDMRGEVLPLPWVQSMGAELGFLSLLKICSVSAC